MKDFLFPETMETTIDKHLVMLIPEPFSMKNLDVAASIVLAFFPLSVNKTRSSAYARQEVSPGTIVQKTETSSSRMQLNTDGNVGSPCLNSLQIRKFSCTRSRQVHIRYQQLARSEVNVHPFDGPGYYKVRYWIKSLPEEDENYDGGFATFRTDLETVPHAVFGQHPLVHLHPICNLFRVNPATWKP